MSRGRVTFPNPLGADPPIVPRDPCPEPRAPERAVSREADARAHVTRRGPGSVRGIPDDDRGRVMDDGGRQDRDAGEGAVRFRFERKETATANQLPDRPRFSLCCSRHGTAVRPDPGAIRQAAGGDGSTSTTLYGSRSAGAGVLQLAVPEFPLRLAATTNTYVRELCCGRHMNSGQENHVSGSEDMHGASSVPSFNEAAGTAIQFTLHAQQSDHSGLRSAGPWPPPELRRMNKPNRFGRTCVCV